MLKLSTSLSPAFSYGWDFFFMNDSISNFSYIVLFSPRTTLEKENSMWNTACKRFLHTEKNYSDIPGALGDIWVNRETKLTFIDCLIMYQVVKEALHTLFCDAAEVPGTFVLLAYKSLFNFKSSYCIVFEAWSLKVGLVFVVVRGLLGIVLV